MLQPAPDRAKPTDTDAALPKSEIRTTVSFLLFVHLFALAVTIFGTERPSELGVALADIPGLKQYREGLLMNWAYTYYFTHGNTAGGEVDVDHKLVAKIHKRDSSEEDAEIVIPEPGMWPEQRLHRYQTLARNVAVFNDEAMGSPEQLGLLVQSIAGSILKEHAGDSLQLRCVGRMTLPAMAEFDPDNPTQRERTRDAYTAQAFWVHDRVELLKKDPAQTQRRHPKTDR